MNLENPQNPETPPGPQGSPPPFAPGQIPAQPRRVEPPYTRPWVNYALMAFTVLLYGLQLYSQQTAGADLPFLLLGKIDELISQGQFWRLITPLFLHGSILHLVVNMYAMYIIGTGLEALYGHWRYLLLYFLSGFGGYALSYALTDNPALGASAGVFGLLAAQGVLVWQNRSFFGGRTRDILTNLVMILVVNLAIGIMPGSRIDNYGHLGGLFAGGLFALMGGPHWQVRGGAQGLQMTDTRTRQEVLIAAVLVLLGFSAVVALVFLRR